MLFRDCRGALLQCGSVKVQARAKAVRAVKAKVTCPACGADDVDVRSYESLMALRSDLALFTLTCPHCAARISALLTIPPELREEVVFAAIELGAGMGAHEGTS